MNFFHASKYLEYLLFYRHKNGHGIHSPFIFDIVSRIFRNKIEGGVVFMVEKIRKELTLDTRMIDCEDLGTGSERKQTRKRKVSDIARYSAVPRKYGLLLSNLSAEFGSPAIMELGTSLGVSTMYMATASGNSVVHTIEGCPACSEIALGNFKSAGVNNVELTTGSFDLVLPSLKNRENKWGLIYIDGNHRKDAVLNYFYTLKDVCSNETVMVFDDIYNSKEMAEAWTEIKKDGKVTASIDIFRMGLVFFKKGITRNHYKIRY
jgi:predicted O-methyltransferase YrrM